MAGITKDLPPIPSVDNAETGRASPIPTQGQPEAFVTTGKSHGSGLFRRLTSKLRTPSATARELTGHDGTLTAASPVTSTSNAPQHKRKPTRTNITPAENSWLTPEQRIAALRARGLLPSQSQPLCDAQGYRLPLSEQEQQLDRDAAIVPRQSEERESEAEKIAEAWMKKNMGDGYRARSRSSEREQEHSFASTKPQGAHDCRSAYAASGAVDAYFASQRDGLLHFHRPCHLKGHPT